MNSLAIDTSNKTLTVAVQLANGTTKEIVIPNTLQHSVTLIPYIEEVLQASGCSIDTFDRIIVAKGPGSYTGLRVGVTVAKTLAYALQVDLVEVSSLAALAANVKTVALDREIVPFFDARRDHIFTGIYRAEEQTLASVVADQYVAWTDWIERLLQRERSYYFVGELDEAHQADLLAKFGDRILFAKGEDHIPHASRMFELASEQMLVDQALAVPTYLKLAEAEENWRKQQIDHKEESYVERL